MKYFNLTLFFVFGFILSFELSLAESRSCSSVLRPKKLSIEEYQKYFLKDHPKAVSNSFYIVSRAVFKSDKKLFQRLIPKSTFPQADRDLSQPLDSLFSEGFRSIVKNRNYFKPRLYHMTHPLTAAEIMNKETTLLLSNGAYNSAAICVGDGSFHMFTDKINPNQASVLELNLHPSARILDLTHVGFGDRGPTMYSYYGSYLWYKNKFIPDLIAGKYKNNFPELTEVAQSEVYRLESLEAFALLMEADMINVTQMYDWRPASEYWIINPEAIINIVQVR